MKPGDITGPRNYEQFPSVPREKTIWGTESVSCNIIALKKGNYFLFFLRTLYILKNYLSTVKIQFQDSDPLFVTGFLSFVNLEKVDRW